MVDLTGFDVEKGGYWMADQETRHQDPEMSLRASKGSTDGTWQKARSVNI